VGDASKIEDLISWAYANAKERQRKLYIYGYRPLVSGKWVYAPFTSPHPAELGRGWAVAGRG
jgi:hypothetical protein